jgi:plastocyanin
VNPMLRRTVTGLLMASVIAVSTAALAPAVLAADTTIDIAGFAFSPQSVTVKVGDTVTWANSDAQGHTASADNGAWDTGTISGNTSKSVTMTTPGTFAYHCKIHETMTATLVVEAAAAPPPTDAAAITPTSSGSGALPVLALVFALGLLAGLRRMRSGATPH